MCQMSIAVITEISRTHHIKDHSAITLSHFGISSSFVQNFNMARLFYLEESVQYTRFLLYFEL